MSARSNVSASVEPMPERMRLGRDMRLTGASWEAIAKRLGFAHAAQASSVVMEAARDDDERERLRTARRATSRASQARELRLAGTPWDVIAERLGYPDVKIARAAALQSLHGVERRRLVAIDDREAVRLALAIVAEIEAER